MTAEAPRSAAQGLPTAPRSPRVDPDATVGANGPQIANLDLDALAAVAQAATPGEWEHVRVPFRDTASHSIKQQDKVLALVGWEQEEPVRAPADAAYIAAFDPPTVLALLAEVAALRQQVAEVEGERDEARSDAAHADAVRHNMADLWLTRHNKQKARAEAAEQKAAALTAERDRLRHLLGSHSDGHLCTCEMTRPGDHISPPEWEQDPWCPTHPDMNYVAQMYTAQARVIEQVRALADGLERTRTNFVDGSGSQRVIDSHVRQIRAALAAAPTPPAEATWTAPHSWAPDEPCPCGQPSTCPATPPAEAEEIEDGFGSSWTTCGAGCDLQVVRSGKVQCNRTSAACPDHPAPSTTDAEEANDRD